MREEWYNIKRGNFYFGKSGNFYFGLTDARDLRKAASIEIDGHEYSYREGKEYENGIITENKYKIAELSEWGISDEEKNEIIKKYTEYWNRYGRNRLYECRASFSCDDIIDRALKRIVQNENSIDYSTGYLVSNQKYGITQSSSTWINDDEHMISVYYSSEGYSIIPSLEEKIKWCSKIAALWAFLVLICTSLLLPLTCYGLYYSILIPIILISKLHSYFLWVKKGFK
jgi:hypothetical protein